MERINSLGSVKALLQEFGVAPHKKLGQNFLYDENVLERIATVADIDEKSVLEIGPGLGHLTQQIAKRAKKVVSVEIDTGFIPVLEKTLYGFENVTLLHQDFLKADLKELHEVLGGGEFAVCANLPYYITTPIIMRILESGMPWTRMSILIQKEVAERICAEPGNKNYGSLSVAVQYYANAKNEFKLGAGCFYPVPQVDSIVVSLERRPAPFKVSDEKLYFDVVRAAFSMRRKTLANNLIKAFNLNREAANLILHQCDIDVGIRGEDCSPADFAVISESLSNNRTAKV